MIKCFFFLLAFTCLTSPVQAMRGDISHNKFTSNNTYTHTPIELKPASFLELDIPSLDGAYKTASVCFLGDKDCGKDVGFEKNKDDKLDIDSANKCSQEGYHTMAELGCKTTVEKLDNLCPYNSSYGMRCVCRDNLFTCTFPQVATGDSCGGKVRFCECPGYEIYQGDCKSPRELSGKCEVKFLFDDAPIVYPFYKNCECPKGVSSPYGCEEYYPAPCDTVCKVAKEETCSGFLTCECGGEIGTETCKSGAVTKYKTCKKCCANECTETAEPPVGTLYRYEACSQKYCITGCDANYTDWCTQPTTNCVEMGYKSTSSCANGGIKCPYGNYWHCY